MAWSTLLAALLAIVLPLDAAAERLALRSYGVTDGLPQEGVKRIVRDSRGFLWFCTFDGLSRYDGTRFVNYSVSDGLPHPSINDLLETRSGVYWIATNGGGVARFDPENTSTTSSSHRLFASYPVGETLATSRVNALREDRDGRIWAGTDDGLFVLDDPRGDIRFRQIDVPFPRPLLVWALVEDRAGRLWVATSEGLARRTPDGRIEMVRVEDSTKTEVWALAEDEEGRLWVGLSNGLRIVRAVDGADPVGRDQIGGRVIALHRSGASMWVGTLGGDVFVVDAGGVRRALHLDEPPTSLAEDHQGNVWISTVRGRTGAIKLARRGFTRYDDSDGLTRGLVTGILETRAGELCVVGDGRLHRFDGHRFIDVNPRFDSPVGIRSAFQDRRGEMWVATDRGVYRFAASLRVDDLLDARPTARYSTSNGLPTDDVLLAFEDARGDIWIGMRSPTAIAVLRRDSNQIETFLEGRGLPAVSTPLAIREDAGGNIWIAFREGGLLRYRSGRFEHFDQARGVPRSEVIDVFVDHFNRLWIATTAALLRADQPASPAPSFVRYTAADGLASDVFRCLTEDSWGRMYICTVRGLDRLDPANGRITHYSTADGLARDELVRAFRDRHGALWFGSWGGVSRLEPELEPEVAAPPVFISGVRAGGHPHPIAEMGARWLPDMTLQPDEAQVAIEYFGLDGAAERLRFQYRLDGADADWNPPTTLRTVNYARLAPGRYRFLVRVIAPSGATSEPASVSFRILRPVWLRWWFLASACGLLLVAAVLLYRYRVAHLLAIERVRTRIATDLHDDIGASLSQIAILSELVRGETSTRPESANTLGRIAAISRELVESMGDIVWAINPKRDRVGDLLQRMRHFASDTLTGRDIHFTFRTPELGRELALGADVRREVLLIFKEAVNNVVRHAACRRVDIGVRIDRDGLVVEVADDGEGLRDADDLEPGHGLVSMRERATRLAGSLELVSVAGRGTTVVLRVPLGRASHAYLSV